MLWFRTAGPESMTRFKAGHDPAKSGISTSTRHSGLVSLILLMHDAKIYAPPSGRSSRLTEVITQ